MSLTRKEEVLLGFIEKHQMKHGSSPTVREMREHMKHKSDNCIVYWVKALAKKGFIKKGDTPRSIALLPSVRERLESPAIRIPVLGNVPAGGPTEASEHVEDWVSLDEGALRDPASCFVLRVRGDSMMEAGIYDGDHVIVDSKRAHRVGDYVVALVDNRSTVKTLAKDSRGAFYLHPENKSFNDIYPEEELIVQGVVVGLMRWYKSA
ncbi:MAG: transcriptional repressor LexA [Patescibacteria group bacterium]